MRGHEWWRRPKPLMLLGCVVALGALGAWVGFSALSTRAYLNQARLEATTLRSQLVSGDLSAAQVTAGRLRTELTLAHNAANGPFWDLAATLPRIGDPVHSVRGMTVALRQLGNQTVPELLAAAQRLDPATLRAPDGQVDLQALEASAPALDRAAQELQRARAHLQSLPAQTWADSVDLARTELLDQLETAEHTLRNTAAAASVLPAMLGGEGERTYLLAYQNNAEARGTGGLAGAFGIVRARDGLLALDQFDSQRVMAGATTKVNFGEDYDRLYNGASTTTLYANSNLSPHFPYAAQIWLQMWESKVGDHVDGVIALDPVVLSHLLEATGPVRLTDGTSVSAANVVGLTQQYAYAKYPRLVDDPARRAYLGQIEMAVSAGIMSPGVDVGKLMRALGKSASERRLLVWSAHPTEQRELERHVIAGAVPETTAPYVGLSIVNEAGNKLDYYLDRSVTWQRTGCGPRREVTVTVALRNNAPGTGLSEVVAARNDFHPYPVEPGDHRLRVDYLATQGAVLKAVTLDGKRAPVTIGRQLGHPHLSVDVELPRERTRTLVLRLSEPDGGGSAPIVLRQPLVRPLQLRVLDASCAPATLPIGAPEEKR